jgi:hypothetical protein
MVNMFGSFMNLEATTKLSGSPQLTPSCDIFQTGMNSFYFFVEWMVMQKIVVFSQD